MPGFAGNFLQRAKDFTLGHHEADRCSFPVEDRNELSSPAPAILLRDRTEHSTARIAWQNNIAFATNRMNSDYSGTINLVWRDILFLYFLLSNGFGCPFLKHQGFCRSNPSSGTAGAGSILVTNGASHGIGVSDDAARTCECLFRSGVACCDV